jgi:hypothetical protein
MQLELRCLSISIGKKYKPKRETQPGTQTNMGYLEFYHRTGTIVGVTINRVRDQIKIIRDENPEHSIDPAQL